jgi:hypothetical protein
MFLKHKGGIRMTHTELLRKRQQMLKEQICSNLDILVGTVGKSPAMKYHNLTIKDGGKTVSRYVRKGLVPKVKVMTQRYQKVYKLIIELSSVNWELLKRESTSID